MHPLYSFGEINVAHLCQKYLVALAGKIPFLLS